MENNSFDEITGWGIGFLTIIFFLTQIFPYFRLILGKIHFQNTPTFYITTCYYNCLLWFIYGKTIFNEKIKISYLISTILCFISLIIYLFYEIRKFFFDAILNFIILSMSTWAIYRYLTIEIDDDLVIGKLCLATSGIIYLYMLYRIYLVQKEKNIFLMNNNLTIFHLIVEIAWEYYGIATSDIYIVINYVFGIFISLLVISLYLEYKKKYSIIDEKTSRSGSSFNFGTLRNEVIISNPSNMKIDDTINNEKPVKIDD